MKSKISIISIIVLLFLIGMLVYSLLTLRERQSVNTEASVSNIKVFVSPAEQTIRDGAFFSVLADSEAAFEEVMVTINFNNELIHLESDPQLMDDNMQIISITSAEESNQSGVVKAHLKSKNGLKSGVVQLLGMDFKNLVSGPLETTIHVNQETSLIDSQGNKIELNVEHSSVSLRKSE